MEDDQDPNKVKIVELANNLLKEWSSLKEVFRIPKKERIEQMKEHEREAGKYFRFKHLVYYLLIALINEAVGCSPKMRSLLEYPLPNEFGAVPFFKSLHASEANKLR